MKLPLSRSVPWTVLLVATITVIAVTTTSCSREQRLLRRARGLVDRGELDAAMEVSLQVLEENPQSHEAYYVIGSIHYAQDAYTEAVEVFDRALEIGGPVPHYLQQRGDAHAHLKRYDEAIRDYEEVLKIDPGHAKAYYGLGIVHYNMRNYDEAVRRLKRYRELESDPFASERARKLIEFLDR